MTISWKVVFYWLLIFLGLTQVTEVSAQRSKKSKITDEIGPLAGVNVVLFYPKDVNRHPINGGNPELLPAAMTGLSYYHSFTPRWAHIFQLRLSEHQIKYWKATEQTWNYNHEKVTVKSDSGDYHLKYRVTSMNYMTGWCLNKNAGWHIYGGFQFNFTIANHSEKKVDRIEYGEIVHFDFIPYGQPLFIQDETSITYSPDARGEILFRTDVRLKLSDRWRLRPVLEYGIDSGHPQVSIKDRVAFYIELYQML